jgi:hypothetical protein
VCESVSAEDLILTIRLAAHPIPSAVGPHSRGAGVVPGVQVERATVRTTWTPGAASARLVPGRWQAGWELPHHSHDEPEGAGRAWSISEPERPRRRHRSDPDCAVSAHAIGFPHRGRAVPAVPSGAET